jgi:two-component system response regulator AtoC
LPENRPVGYGLIGQGGRRGVSEEVLDDETAIVRTAASAETSTSLSLVIISPGGTGNVALPERGTLTIGRSAECDVRIDDTKLSRKHAEIRRGDEIHIVDLGSRNGTQVREERIAPNVPVALRAGDSIAIGSSVLVLQSAAAGVERPRHLWSHGYFEARLEEEFANAAADTSFAIVRLRVNVGGEASKTPTISPAAADTAGLAQAADAAAPAPLVKWLRPADMIGVYAPNEYEVLLTKTSYVEAEARMSQLARSLRRAGVAFGIALASYPRDGRTPEALVEHASRLLRKDAAPAAEAAERPVLPMGALERMDPIVVRVAAGTINVLVLGETGVGKEVLSRRIHTQSPRAQKALVSLNCAALSESLLESELFGHEKGAFTGALAAKAGLLESADGGTVFLDEIGEMPLSVQAKLLRVIEQREVTRVGALRPHAIDVRFVSATHRDLEAEIARGRFRQDLYFRLNGISLSIPPLRERVDEIEPLAIAFIAHSCRAMQRALVPRLGADALDTLRRYQWPGNIRELRNVIERAVLLCSGEVITREHLPMEKLGVVLAPSMRISARPALPLPQEDEDDLPVPPDGVTGEISIPSENDLERARIMDALEKCGGNQSQAAKLLGTSRQTLIRRIQEYDIPRPRKRD